MGTTPRSGGTPLCGPFGSSFSQSPGSVERCFCSRLQGQLGAPSLPLALSRHTAVNSRMSASLIGRLGSSAFRLSTNSSVDVAHGLSLLFGLGTKGPSIMGFEDEVEQSFGRPCRQCDGRFKRTYELTSSIVPRGTSFH